MGKRAALTLVSMLVACSDGGGAIIDARPIDGSLDGVVAADAASPDATNPDAASPDAASPDAADVDAASPDAASPDAASPDAADVDAATPDAATLDASPSLDAAPAIDAGLCGNGTVDPGETCDGNCPTTCADALTCTTDAMVGAAATCDVACVHAGTGCAAGDGCCSPGCDNATDSDCPFVIAPFYDPAYDIRDLGSAPGVPTNYGGLTIVPSDPSTLLIGGAANGSAGAIYRLGVQRDVDGHIVGLIGPATLARAGAYNDGGVLFTDTGVLMLARYPTNEFGMQRAGSTVDDKIVALTPIGIPSSVGGLAVVPPGHPGAGRWKSLSYPTGQWCEFTLTPDAIGTYDVSAPVQRTTLVGGPEGIAYVPLGSPLFPNPSVIISEYQGGRVVTYEVDALGDPIVATRRDLITSLAGAEGATIDPVSGDFLFSTFGGGNRVLVVRGFQQTKRRAP